MRPVTQSTGPHLFLDNFLIDTESGASRIVVPPVKHAQPVVDGPTDKCFQPYVSVHRIPETGRFRIWYAVPESAVQSHWATMESADGIHWERPHRVLDDPGHIQFGVSVLDDQGIDPDPRRRWKMGWYAHDGLQIAASADGLHWSKLAPGPVLRHNHDINHVYRDPVRNRYGAVVSQVVDDPEWGGPRRIPYHSESTDLIRWSRPRRIIHPEPDETGEVQFYAMGGVIARGDLLIGLVKVLRDDLPAEPGGPKAGLGYTTLAWSRDGKHWERDRTAWLDRSPVPLAWDRAMAWGDCQLPVGDTLHVYYGGYRRGHKVERFTERQIGLATCLLDRYVARRAGSAIATLETPWLTAAGESLTVNANLRGPLTVAVIDGNGAPLRGFGHGSCRPTRGDSVRHVVRWRGNPPLPKRNLRLQFRWSDGDVFGFQFNGKGA